MFSLAIYIYISLNFAYLYLEFLILFPYDDKFVKTGQIYSVLLATYHNL